MNFESNHSSNFMSFINIFLFRLCFGWLELLENFQKHDCSHNNILQITQICFHGFMVGNKDIFYGRFEVCTKLDVAIMFFVIWGTKIYN